MLRWLGSRAGQYWHDTRAYGSWQSALDQIASDGGGRLVVSPDAAHEVSEDLTYDAAAGPLVVVAYGATITQSGTGELLRVHNSSGGGGTNEGPTILGGTWIGNATATHGLVIDDTSRCRIRDAWFRGWTTGTAVEVRNTDSFSEQTRIDGCILSNSKHALRTVPASLSGGTGTESFARTRVRDTIVSNGTSGEALIDLNGGVYDSIFDGIAGNMAAGAHLFNLNGGLLGTEIRHVGIEGGDSTSRLFVPGASLTDKPTLLPIIRAASPIEVADDLAAVSAHMPTLGPVTLPNARALRSRNNADSADVEMIRLNTNDRIYLGWGGTDVEFAGDPIVTSPNGTRYRITVDDAGNLGTA